MWVIFQRRYGGIDHGHGPALRFPHQPHVIVVQDRDTDDV
jgi:hypothetical protein